MQAQQSLDAHLQRTPPPKGPYKGFLDIQEASELMGGDRPYFHVVSNKIHGYRVQRSSNFLFSRFQLQMNGTLRNKISILNRHDPHDPTANESGPSSRVELVFLLFHVCLHVLTLALPKDFSIQHEELYSKLQRMIQSVSCDLDLQSLLVQFMFAFPMDKSIQGFEDMISSAWMEDHHPSVFLEMTAIIGCLKLASKSTRPIEEGMVACRAMLSSLDSFHRRSGTHLTVSFMKAHLNRRSRRDHNPDAPRYWYQSLLSRIAQIWLSSGSGAATGKRKLSQALVCWDHNARLQHWDGWSSHKLMDGIHNLPMGIPSCLLTNGQLPTVKPKIHHHQPSQSQNQENIPPNRDPTLPIRKLYHVSHT